MSEAEASTDAALPVEHGFLEDWPLRPWLLAALGALAGLVIHHLLDAEGEAEGWRAAVAGGLFFAFAAASFVLRPARWVEAAVFAVGLGVVMGGISWLAVDSGDHVAGEGFAFAAGVFFSLLAVPLFQADFHRQRWATPYVETHFHVWTDAVSAGGALLFVLLSWALLWLLHALFALIGIEVIGDLIEAEGFVGLFMGATYGAAMGVLRNQLGIIGTLQRVVMLVFALLAVPFGLAILLFLVILLLSGGSALWEATDSATPVLLTCALGCFVLANAVFRDDDESRSRSVVMQAAAMVLAASIFPLTVFAAISMGLRIDQHGLSPERLWALVAIVIACAYGLAYWVGLARGRLAGWAHYLRRANLNLAVASCVIALLLALPLVDFGRISANNQLSRLQSGKVSAADFDYGALRWDFGDAGRRILAVMAESDDEELARQATEALNQTERVWDYYEREPVDAASLNLRMVPDDPELREFVLERISQEPWACDHQCAAIDIGPDASGNRRVAVVQDYTFNVYTMGETDQGSPAMAEEVDDHVDLQDDSTIEVRTVPQRYIFIDGKPVNHPLDDVADLERLPASE